MTQSSDVEDLLAQALAAHDEGPEALAAFLARHAAHRPVLERGLERCRQMGLLGGTASAVTTLEFPERLGPFRLLRRLGAGGMGTVFEALQEDPQRRVALKVIRPELLWVSGARERFRREIEAIGRLDHPAIVSILLAGEHEGIPYFAMPLLLGASLGEATNMLRGRPLADLRGVDLYAAILACLGRTPSRDETTPANFAGAYWEAALRAGIQVGDGVAHAHAHGIVHRDIKPGNVMLMPDGRALVLDFGVARVRGSRELTRSSEPGSPAFMSPEQLGSEPTDERTDVYSLGLTLRQLLTREPPFSPRCSEADVVRGELPALHLGRGVPRDLTIVLGKATDRDRRHRYVSMAAFVADLQAVLARAPIRGRRLPWTRRAARFVQRHRVATAVAATLLCGAIAWPLALRAERLAAERSLAEAAQRAEQSLLATLDTLAAAEERMGGTNLPDIAEVDPLARELLADSLARYRELLATHGAQPRLARQAAAAMYRSGQVSARAGDTKVAAALFDEALRTLGDLPPGASDSTFELRGEVRLALASLAFRASDFAAAGAACEQAKRDAEVLQARSPGAVATLRLCGELAINLAKLFPEREQVADAERHLQAALALAEQWTRVQPDSVDAQIALVRRHSSLGVLLRRAGEPARAAPHLLAAVERARALPDNNRLWPPPRALQSMALESYANLLIDRGDAAARAFLEESIALREALVERLPEQTVFRVHLGNAYQNLGRCFLMTGDVVAAERWIRRACDTQLAVLAAKPGFADAQERLDHHRYSLAKCLSEQGKADELIANAEALAERTGNAVAQHTAAWSLLRAIALAAPEQAEVLRARHSARAMALLEATASLGWDPVWQLDDPVYEPLHGMPAFAALRQRVTAAK
ncbi:MAG: protein kinase [Planctomycetes bacterium]|nr:protein kinase [Planctomycetota bacterium]